MKKLKTPAVRHWAVLLFGALVYGKLYAFGSQIDETGSCTIAEGMRRLIFAYPVALAALLLLFVLLPRWQSGKNASLPEKPLRFHALPVAAGIFVCYIPMLLVQYPAVLCYDVQAQTFQIARNAYSAFHPLLHTLLIRFCLSLYGVLQSYEKCALVYSLIQMSLMALCFAGTCASISRMRSARAGYIAAAFFSLYPAHMAFATSFTKDVIFSAFFALFFALSMEAMTQELSRPRRVLLVLCGVIACLMRNNMTYALLAWLILLLPFVRRFGRVILCGVLVLVLALSVNAGLKAATHADNGKKIEMLSVPLQQLARARLYADDRFTEEQRAQMDAIFVDKTYLDYEPTLADRVKNRMQDEDVLSDAKAFAGLWLSVGAKCPDVYLDAFLNLILPSIYPYSHYRVAQPYIETGEQPGALTAPFAQAPIVQPARMEAPRKWLAEHIFNTGADDIPLVRLFFNCGAFFWLALCCVLHAAYQGDGRRLAAMALPLMLYATYLLGPVMQGRYLYPFVCCLPVLWFKKRPAAASTSEKHN